jgi:hypothetical protein
VSLYGLQEMEVVTRLNAGLRRLSHGLVLTSLKHCASHVTRHMLHATSQMIPVTLLLQLRRVTHASERAHVIVDLNTWTDGHVISSIASTHLLAPVVVSAIGHPGTSGSYSHTHVLVDAVSAPSDLFISR